MRRYKQLLLANKAWAAELTDENPDFFARQTVGQKPEFLWIGCSDSRVSPEQMTMTQPGGMFIHRNIGNLVNDHDLNLMSVLQYAVDVLGVKHVIVCGHYGCGGVRAALDGSRHGLVDNWLRHVMDVAEKHAGELASPPEERRFDRLCELNVVEQVVNVSQTTIVEDAWACGQELTVHGLVYGLEDGLLRDLGVSATA